MVGWPWRTAGNGVDGQPREEGGQPIDMESGNTAASLPNVEKDVLAAGRAACYKINDFWEWIRETPQQPLPHVKKDVLAAGRAVFQGNPQLAFCSSGVLSPTVNFDVSIRILVSPLDLGGVRQLGLTDIFGQQARDNFFKCVETDNGHTTPTEIASAGLLYPAQCKSARAFYEQNCRSTWVKHFDRQFGAKKKVKRLLDTGDRARGPINLPANRVGLQSDEQ